MSWIPVEERLPECMGFYCVTLASGCVRPAYYSKNLGEFDYASVIAWQPLPAPYVKPRRFVVEDNTGRGFGPFTVRDSHALCNDVMAIRADNIPTREGAQKIADIYERLHA